MTRLDWERHPLVLAPMAGGPSTVELAVTAARGGFLPFRRDVDWLAAEEAPIQPLLATLDFTGGVRNWGYQLRFGLFPVSDHDWHLIAGAMRASLSA